MKDAGHPYEEVEIPYDDKLLQGYLLQPRISKLGDRPPCVIFLSGADALSEENFFLGIQYIKRKMNAVGVGVIYRKHEVFCMSSSAGGYDNVATELTELTQ